MGDYFAEKWAALRSLPAEIAKDPVTFAILFVIAVPIIWWKWRAGGNTTQDAIDSTTHGLRVSAAPKTVAHETGIGTQDILVMRPAPLAKGIYFGLFFFGGGAIFYFLAVLPSPDVMPKDWWSFAGMVAFTVCGIVLIILNLTRITVSATTIEKRRVFGKRQRINISDISGVEPLSGDFARGAHLRTTDGQAMRIGATFSGYRDLILRLKGIANA